MIPNSQKKNKQKRSMLASLALIAFLTTFTSSQTLVDVEMVKGDKLSLVLDSGLGGQVRNHFWLDSGERSFVKLEDSVDLKKRTPISKENPVCTAHEYFRSSFDLIWSICDSQKKLKIKKLKNSLLKVKETWLLSIPDQEDAKYVQAVSGNSPEYFLAIKVSKSEIFIELIDLEKMSIINAVSIPKEDFTNPTLVPHCPWGRPDAKCRFFLYDKEGKSAKISMLGLNSKTGSGDFETFEIELIDTLELDIRKGGK